MERDEHADLHHAGEAGEASPRPESEPPTPGSDPEPMESPARVRSADPADGAAAEAAPAGAPASSEAATPEAPETGGDLEGHHLLELWSDREEIHALPEILRPAEGLAAVGSGTIVRSGRLAQSKWLVVLTDRRLLCIKGRAAVTRKVIDMPVSQIRGVETKGLIRKTMSLDTGYGTLRISGMKKGVAAEMVAGLTTLMGAYGEDDESKPTAIRRADLSKAGPGGGGGQNAEEIQGLKESMATLQETMDELKERVAFVEELVRSNVDT